MPCDHQKALQLARAGEFGACHRIVQSHSDPLSCRIHAYLHRLEGDTGNAAYWYREAGAEPSRLSPAAELEELCRLAEPRH